VGTNPATVPSSRSNDPEQAADSLLSGLAGGPLPWLPGIPDRIAANPNWGPYLDARSHLVAQLGDQIHLNAKGAPALGARSPAGRA
jgi:hypothetical protein